MSPPHCIVGLLVIGLAGAGTRAASADAILGHGTYFVASVSTENAVVAIDSRLTTEAFGSQVINDRYCKIRPLAKNAFFFATGITAGHDKNKKATFDAGDEARRVHRLHTPDFAKLADSWGARMATAYGRILGPLKPGRFQNPMATGYFVGTDANGNIRFSGASLSEQSAALPRFKHTNETIKPGPPDDMTIVDHGYEEIVREFGGGQTPRARQALASIDNHQTPLQRTAFVLGAMVAAVRDWSGNDEIGGDIAVIVLERDTGWRWFQRPDFCPERSD